MAVINPGLYQSMEYRCIGPYRGGRVLAVAGDPVDPAVFYFGACSGGLWKTYDGGVYWHNISDGFFKTASVGAIAIAPSDPNVIYVGMGEACIRSNTTYGDGVYKSTDGGKSWVHLGLEDTRHIARVRVHPNNPDLVYVAALGHAYGSNEERGVFRSIDGGKNWQKVLYKSEKAGAIDLSMDATNPRILFASIYEVRRYSYHIVSGGADSGLYRSTDGGDSWSDISNNPGFSKEIKGRIGVAASPAKAGRVWALVDAKDGGLFRSDNGGDTWENLTDNPNLRVRPFYYTHIFAHPTDPDTVYVLTGFNWKSTDGGRTFDRFTTPHEDNHDLWIDPSNPNRMIHGNDEGASISFNGGLSFSRLNSQPISQFYHVTTDNQFPYRVYGSQQDDSSITVPSRSHSGAITQTEWYAVGGGEAGYIAVRPDDSNIVYAAHSWSGPFTRYDHRTGQARDIKPWPERVSGTNAEEFKYRFQWTFPIILSPHNPDILYTTGNVVFRSYDEGSSWDVISPDLTRNDTVDIETLGGPIPEALPPSTIFAFAESTVKKGILWAGSDDGLIHVSTDDGKSWENVTPKEMPSRSLISIIEPSTHDPSSAYVAATCYKLDDTRPYLYKTDNFGKSWKKITNGIRVNDFTRVIREDPQRRGLLYAGTETGIYVSFNDGTDWQSLQLNLPIVPVHDLVVKNNDLVVATHGRSFWILDNITPLHQITEDISKQSAYLFKPHTAHRFPMWRTFPSQLESPRGMNYDRASGPLVHAWHDVQNPNGDVIQTYLDAGKNPPDGVMVYYLLNQLTDKNIQIEFADANDKTIRIFDSKDGKDEPIVPRQQQLRISMDSGMNRFLWDMRYPGSPTLPSNDRMLGWGPGKVSEGPLAPPGKYKVKITIDNVTYTEEFEICKNPRISASQEDLESQFKLSMKIVQAVSNITRAVTQIRSVREQISGWVSRITEKTPQQELIVISDNILTSLSDIEQKLTSSGNKGPVNQVGRGPAATLDGKFNGLLGVITSADFAPTKQSHEVFDILYDSLGKQLSQLELLLTNEIPEFNNLISKLNLAAISDIN